LFWHHNPRRDATCCVPTGRQLLESDNIRGPYQHLKNLGWISRYTRDLNTCLAFTVEGALFYLLGQKWQQRSPGLEDIKTILQGRNKLHCAGVESFLCEEANSGQINLLTELIDEGEEYLDECVPGLVAYIKKYGSEATLNAVLANPTENDWKALLKLTKLLEEQQLRILRKDFLKFVIGRIPFDSKSNTELGLKAISILDDDIAQLYYSKINTTAEFFKNDSELTNAFGKCEERFGHYDLALDFFQQCLDIQLKTLGKEHPDVATSYNNIGSAWRKKGDYDKALDFYQQCLDIELKTLGKEHPYVASSYRNIGSAWNYKGDHDKALDFYQQCLDIRLKTLGKKHPDLADSYNNIGLTWEKMGNHEKAQEYYRLAGETENPGEPASE
jgi:tetratricopeptide (TPR) repeat protein